MAREKADVIEEIVPEVVVPPREYTQQELMAALKPVEDK